VSLSKNQNRRQFQICNRGVVVETYNKFLRLRFFIQTGETSVFISASVLLLNYTCSRSVERRVDKFIGDRNG